MLLGGDLRSPSAFLINHAFTLGMKVIWLLMSNQHHSVACAYYWDSDQITTLQEKYFCP